MKRSLSNHKLVTTGVLLVLSLLLTSCTPEKTDVKSESLNISDNTMHSDLTSKLPEMVVYKSPTCGCCQGWVDYVEKAGFSVNAINHDNVDAIKVKHGLIDPALKSCHTAIVDGYVIEGHVPVSDIERLLSERPDIIGLTAPGMPMMSPGMNSEIPKDYDVLAFDRHGKSRVFSSY
ncbi:MAG: hypothetical protein ACI9XK_002537 [Granulosicoccus sp.]